MDDGFRATGEAMTERRLLPGQGQGGSWWHGSCGCEHYEGREAVMPESGLEIDLAECEDLCRLQWEEDEWRIE